MDVTPNKWLSELESGTMLTVDSTRIRGPIASVAFVEQIENCLILTGDVLKQALDQLGDDLIRGGAKMKIEGGLITWYPATLV